MPGPSRPVSIKQGDCLAVLRRMPDNSVDSIVTDPPYGLEFMGKDWDGADGFRRSLNPADTERPNVFGRMSRKGPEYRAGALFQEWCEAWATEALRVLKPGGHMLAFGGTRTWHRLACAVEDAGFEVRDSIAWLYGSGFPKSLNVGRWVDTDLCLLPGKHKHAVTDKPGEHTCPRTPEGEAHDHEGTALKPAFEPIVVARKPLSGTVAANVLTHGTGALNIDACRVGGGTARPARAATGRSGDVFGAGLEGSRSVEDTTAGRWPANVVLSDDQAAELDRQSGTLTSQATRRNAAKGTAATDSHLGGLNARRSSEYLGESGGASRFFPTFSSNTEAPVDVMAALRARLETIKQKQEDAASSDGYVCEPMPHQDPEDCSDHDHVPPSEPPVLPTFRYQAKAPTKERPTYVDDDGRKVAHPTVKPLALIRWLVTLVTPPGGTVLDPFAGTGPVGEAALLDGFRAILIEREADYLPLIYKRLERAAATLPAQ